MKRRKLLFYSLMFMMGCMGRKKSGNKLRFSSDPIIPKTLSFAVTDAMGLRELEDKYDLFRLSLSEVLDCNIEFFPVDNYFTAAAALNAHEVDLVWAGPSEYVVIKARSNAIPIIGIQRVNYHTIMVVLKESDITSLINLKGKIIDFQNNGSTSTHLGGVKLLMDAGLSPLTDFQSMMSQSDSLTPLINKTVDACSRSPHRYQNALKKDGLSEADFSIIAQGKPLPNDVFVMGSHITSEIANYIKQLMLENQQKLLDAILSVESLGIKLRGATLTTASDQDYDVVRDIYRAMGQGNFLD